MNDLQKKYLDETGHRLRRKGFTVLPKNEGVLQVEMAGVLLCHINMRRGMCYDADLVQRNGLEDALDQVRSIAVETQAYMRQMAAAPPLLAEGLSGNYRLLAEFNHIILAGHERDGGYGGAFGMARLCGRDITMTTTLAPPNRILPPAPGWFPSTPSLQKSSLR